MMSLCCTKRPATLYIIHSTLSIKTTVMYKYILAEAGNINWMAIFALLTFFILFVMSAVLVLRRNGAFIEKMSRLPLDED